MSNKQFFETIKCEDEEVFNLEYHQERISRTIQKNINLGEYIYPPSSKLLKCKVIYTKDEVCSIEYAQYKARDIKSFKIMYDNNIDYKYKSVNRTQIDNLYIQKDNCDEIIIVKNDLVTDTSIANIAICEDGIWTTPKKPLLKGTIRAKLLNDKFLKEGDISIKRLQKASKIAIMNAMIGFRILEEYSILNSLNVS